METATQKQINAQIISINCKERLNAADYKQLEKLQSMLYLGEVTPVIVPRIKPRQSGHYVKISGEVLGPFKTINEMITFGMRHV